MKKAAFHTLGCKVNQYETEALKEQFEYAGYDIVDENDIADVYVINTCTVTSLADRKSRQYIRKMKHNNPDSIIAVTGCYVQTATESVSGIKEVDIVAGTNEKHRLLEYIENYDGNKQIHVKERSELIDYENTGIIKAMESRNRGYIKIEEGCDRFCSYCVIPYARGPVRSRPENEIINEAKSLVDGGIKEIILTGINTALYTDLAGLLGKLETVAGDFRIRLSSLEPTVIDEGYVKTLFPYERLCHHLHLSLQSGSDSILRSMNRRYDSAQYMKIVETLRNFDPLYGISTDIIAGFPGETEADIECSLGMIRKADFCRVHVFGYSKRDKTVAADMPDQIPAKVKKERVERLIKQGEKIAAGFARKNIGTVNSVVFEDKDPDCGLFRGYTDNYIRAYSYTAPSEDACMKVRITGSEKDGVIVEDWIN